VRKQVPNGIEDHRIPSSITRVLYTQLVLHGTRVAHGGSKRAVAGRNAEPNHQRARRIRGVAGASRRSLLGGFEVSRGERARAAQSQALAAILRAARAGDESPQRVDRVALLRAVAAQEIVMGRSAARRYY
jgi:hypothetical protein